MQDTGGYEIHSDVFGTHSDAYETHSGVCATHTVISTLIYTQHTQSLASNSQFVPTGGGLSDFFASAASDVADFEMEEEVPLPFEGTMCEEGVMVSVTVPDALSEMSREALEQSLKVFWIYMYTCIYV